MEAGLASLVYFNQSTKTRDAIQSILVVNGLISATQTAPMEYFIPFNSFSPSTPTLRLPIASILLESVWLVSVVPLRVPIAIDTLGAV